ncbi:MAG: hypothetical protein LC130_28515 [Bryobacterales bacterium]|nr:hypothetical protein [Bryobacterales bacterium]
MAGNRAGFAHWLRALEDVLLIAGCALMLPAAIMLTAIVVLYILGGHWPWAP